MHDAFNVILWMSADIRIVHDDLGWKNWTTLYILPHHWLYEWFSSAEKRPQIYASGMTISNERSEQHVIGFGELAAVN